MAKQAGRPRSFKQKELRKLDEFLRTNYLQHLSGNLEDLATGDPIWERGKAYFDPEHFHIEFIETTDMLVSQWQTTNALTQLGVRSVQRRLPGGFTRRLRVVPIPDGATCEKRHSTPAETAEYLALMPGYAVGSQIGEGYVKAKREYELHGLSRRARRFVSDVVEEYDDERRGLCRDILASWHEDEFVKGFYDDLRIEPIEDGDYAGMFKVYFDQTDKGFFTTSSAYYEWPEHVMRRSELSHPALIEKLYHHKPPPYGKGLDDVLFMPPPGQQPLQIADARDST